MSLLSEARERLQALKQGVKKTLNSPVDVRPPKALSNIASIGEKASKVAFQPGYEGYKQMVSGAKEIVRAPARVAVQTGISIDNKKRVFTPTTLAEKLIYGERPIESVAYQVPSTQKSLEKYGIKNTPGLLLAGSLTAAAGVADIIPGGGGKKKVAKESIESIAEGLVKSRATREALEQGTKELKRVSTILPDDLIRTVGKGQKQTKTLKQVPEQLAEVGGSGTTKPGSIKDSWDNSISKVKDKANDLYFNTVDKFDPIVRRSKKYGKDKEAQMVLADYYGTGSQADYIVNYELAPILRQTKTPEMFEDVAIFLRDSDLASKGKKGSNRNITMESLIDRYGEQEVRNVIDNVMPQVYKLEKDVFVKELVDTGIMDRAKAEKIFADNPNYIPYKRIMEEADDFFGIPRTKGAGSVSKQDVVYEYKGSDREILSPTESVIENIYKMKSLGNRQRLANFITERMGEFDDEIKPLRTADNVLKRMDIFSSIKQLGKDRRYLDRLIKTRKGWAREIQSELNKLNKLGIEQYLKRGEEASPQVRGVLETKTKFKKSRVSTDTGTFSIRYPVSQETRFRNTELSSKEFKKLINDLVNETPEKIDAIKRKITVKNRKLAPVLDDIKTLGQNSDFLKARGKDLRDEAAILKDAESRGKLTINRIRNGIKEIWEVPEDIYKSARGLNQDQSNILLDLAGNITSAFRATATGINPEFFLTNPIRDIKTAFFNFGVNPMGFVEGLSHMLKQDDVYKEFVKQGGSISRVSIDRPVLQRTVKDIYEGGKLGIKVTKASDALRIVQKFASLSEQPTRITAFEQVYKRLVKQGVDQQTALKEATIAAQEASVNFARSGASMKSANRIYAFLNARIQGIDRVIRTAKENPKQAALRMSLGVAAPTFALYAWNRNFSGYNDNRVISDRDKRENWIIFLSDTPIKSMGGAQYIKIPKAEHEKVMNPMEEFLSYMDGNGFKTKDVISDFLSAFSPIDNPGELIPTFAKPVAELYFNKNTFTGYEIVPEYKKRYPGAEQYTDYTSPVYRMIGDQLNVSPAKIQHIVEGYGTGIARIGEMATRPLVPEEYQNTKGQPINSTVLLRKVLGGEKKTLEEYYTGISKSKVPTLYEELSKSPDNRLQILRDLKQYNEPVYKEMVKYVRDMSSGVSKEDLELKDLGVRDGSRARTVYRKMSKMSPEERKIYWKRLRETNVLTDEVAKQVIDLINGK